jgi:sulfatase maturation enzyme AslB (radical SAM superfamily)
MSFDEFSLILDKLKGKTAFLYYHLMGEPLTHPLLIDFIRLAKTNEYKSIITTNGTLLNKRGYDLIQSGLHKVNISLHSFEDGTDEEYRKYVSDIADFAKKAANQGIIIVFRLWNNGFDEGRNQSALNLLKEYIPGEWSENTRGLKICDNTYLEYGDRFEWPDSNAEIKGKRFFCYGLKDQFGILSDGTVVPCCLDSDGIINLGNIFTEDIDSILNSKRATDIVNGFKCGCASEDLCKRCGYAQRFV